MKDNVIQIRAPRPLIEPGMTSAEIATRFRSQGAKVTDGPIDMATFASGWGKGCFHGKKVHHWRMVAQECPLIIRGVRVYELESACGQQFHPYERAPLFGEGNWPRCKVCEARMAKRSQP